MKNNYRDDSRERYRRRERKLRSMYRRRIFIVFVLALVLGILLGWIGHSRLAPKPAAVTPTPAPVITAEPEATPWADPEMADDPEVSLDEWEDTNNWDNADWDDGEELTTDDWGEEDDWGETADEDFDFGEDDSQSIDDLFGLEDDYDLTGEEELPFDVTDENPFEMEGDPFDFGDEEDPFAGIPEEPVSEEPTEEPAAEPAVEPTAEPTEEPVAEEPTAEPTVEPTVEPTEEPVVEEATAEPTAEPTEEPTAELTAEPTEEPTPEPTAEPVPENVVGGRDLPVDLGAEYSFTMQVLSDGTPRTDGAAEYFDVPVTVALTRHMDTQYYVDNYSTSYQLRGDEACCEVKVTIGDCEGLNTFSLQDALPMVLVDAEGNVIPGYQFRNAEIGGETESQVATGSSATVYKRYSAAEEVNPVALLVTYYVDGQMQEAYFSLTKAEEEPSEETPSDETEPTEETAPEAEPTSDPAGESYTIGSSGEGVKKMQNKLIQLGYLSGVGDGEFGKWTAAAVKEAQKAFGLEVTGVADPAFLEILYTK